MTLHHLTADLSPDFAPAFARFEREFTYPLGPDTRFRISHGQSYLPFFRAMGQADISVIGQGQEILGCLARVARRLCLSAGEAFDAHYLCDLKLRASARGSTVLPRLIRETKRVIEASASTRCYSVVMGGTGKLPTDYTGRLGVPRFELLGEIAILRVEGSEGGDACHPVSASSFKSMSARLPREGYSACGADRALRSMIEPIHLVTSQGDACGIIEDTRKGKQLFREDGVELLSAHLSGFSFASASAGARLLQDASFLARQAGFPALFAAVPSSRAGDLLACLGALRVTVAPASIYGHALEPGHDWWIDTAEI
jgi:hypothetical protein